MHQQASSNHNDNTQAQSKQSVEPNKSAKAQSKSTIQAKQKPIQAKQRPVQAKQKPIQAKQRPVQAKQKPVQRNSGGSTTKQSESSVAQVKANVSQLMGTDVTNAQVNFNSSKPAQFKAEGVAQGNQVDLAPGKSQHLGHELVHVAQQKQGRVQPTVQGNNGVGINNDPKLEKEADEVGAKAQTISPTQLKQHNEEAVTSSQTTTSSTAQLNSPKSQLLSELLETIKGKTGSIKEIFETNRDVQEQIAQQDWEDKQDLTPFFTTTGFEAEFAQQPTKQFEAGNPYSQAHKEVSRSPGYALYRKIPFLLETDAGGALEFVTPPFLVPLQPGQEDRVIPDFAWIKHVTHVIDHGMQDLVHVFDGPTKLVNLIKLINRELPLPAKFANANPETNNLLYRTIQKFGGHSHTGAQLNYMTTLKHYYEKNTQTEIKQGKEDKVIKDDVTYQIHQQLIGADNTLAHEDQVHQVFAVAQKLREIPSSLLDMYFSWLLHKDDNKEWDGGDNKEDFEKLEEWSKTVVPTRNPKKPKTKRRDLAHNASKVKDKSVLWLKASLHQILQGMPPATSTRILTAANSKKEQIKGILINTGEAKLLKESINATTIDGLIGNKLDLALQAKGPAELAQKAEADFEGKPKEQKTMNNEGRMNIIGARPDTYAPTVPRNGKDTLFLVETRRTTPYLNLNKTDRYRFQQVIKEIETKSKRDRTEIDLIIGFVTNSILGDKKEAGRFREIMTTKYRGLMGEAYAYLKDAEDAFKPIKD